MTFKKVNPFTNRTDRIVQIRSLLRHGATAKDFAEMGFDHMEVAKVQQSVRDAEAKPKQTYEKKPKKCGRCKECGGLGDAETFVNRVCQACICRARTNYERKGRWMV